MTAQPIPAPGVWQDRAAAAAAAVYGRHLAPLPQHKNALLGLTRWPPTAGQRIFKDGNAWHYWWQAHLIDCAVDTFVREPSDESQDRIRDLIRGLWLRNRRQWTNVYYDDMAWLGIALTRAWMLADVREPDAIAVLTRDIADGRSHHGGGGIWWRKHNEQGQPDNFKNAPANGPAAIFLALASQLTLDVPVRSVSIARDLTLWIEHHLIDRTTGQVWDGLHVDPSGNVIEVEAKAYSYCQGVFLGACLQLSALTGQAQWGGWAARTLNAIIRHWISPAGVLRNSGGGDDGLFGGILARYVAQAALHMPRLSGSHELLRNQARWLVLQSAQAAWEGRAETTTGPLFSHDWTLPAAVPATSKSFHPRGKANATPDVAERDLSVQTSSLMLLEAAALLERSPR